MTGVQTCALPISAAVAELTGKGADNKVIAEHVRAIAHPDSPDMAEVGRGPSRLAPADFDAAVNRAKAGDAVTASVRFDYSPERAETSVSAGLPGLSAERRTRIGESAALYQAGFSDSISGYLREGLTPETGGQRIAEAVDDLRLATERSRLASDSVVWRGVKSGEAILDAPDPAFVSLSSDRAVAENYAGDSLLRVLLPKGSPVARLSTHDGESEGELLTSPGWTLRTVRDHGPVSLRGGQIGRASWRVRL